jgi:hypothetical protein
MAFELWMTGKEIESAALQPLSLARLHGFQGFALAWPCLDFDYGDGVSPQGDDIDFAMRRLITRSQNPIALQSQSPPAQSFRKKTRTVGGAFHSFSRNGRPPTQPSPQGGRALACSFFKALVVKSDREALPPWGEGWVGGKGWKQPSSIPVFKLQRQRINLTLLRAGCCDGRSDGIAHA